VLLGGGLGFVGGVFLFGGGGGGWVFSVVVSTRGCFSCIFSSMNVPPFPSYRGRAPSRIHLSHFAERSFPYAPSDLAIPPALLRGDKLV